MLFSFTPTAHDDLVLSWIEQETSSLDLGDTRLAKRQCQLLARLFQQMSQSIPGACQGGAETKAA